MDPDPTIAMPAGAGPAPEPSARRLTAAGVVVSVALHLLGLGAIRLMAAPPAPAPPSMTVIDLDLAPVAPAAESLPPEEALAATAPATAPELGVPALPPATEPDGVAALDAGVDARPVDAGADAALDARGRGHDAGAPGGGAADARSADDGRAADGDATAAPPDGALVATGELDAGIATVDGGPLMTSTGYLLDGGALATGAGTSLDGGALATGADAGTAVATTGTPDRTGSAGPKTSSGTAANLLAYVPEGHVVTLLARMDRLRGTEWADQVEAMLAPLPDHGALIGDQPVRITELFETLVISSPDPQRADATTLVGRTRLAPAALRHLLDQPDLPVRWTPTVGGALGRRQPSPRLIPGDPRVFLTWAPGWTTLARPTDLAGLLQPATIGLDHAFAAPDRLPGWLARVSTIEDESGTDDGPALMLTAGGMFPARIDLPLVDVDLPGPQRATLTLTVDPAGFVVRGSLRYPDEGAAATAADALVRAQRELTSSTLARLALGTARAWNAVHGLTVQRTGARVAFATSISTGDGRVLLARIADLMAAHFDQVRRRPRP